MESYIICLVLITLLVILLHRSYSQSSCDCSGIFAAQFGENPLGVTFTQQRTLRFVIGLAYDIKCIGISGEPDWQYGSGLVSSATADEVYQISESTNEKTLKFTKFAADQIGKYSCVKSCGIACTIDFLPGNPVLNLNQQLATDVFASSIVYSISYFVSGIPPPSVENVTWTHNGELLMGKSNLTVTYFSNGILIIPPFTPAYEGEYTAKVTTSTGSGSDSFYLNLKSYPLARLDVQCGACVQSDTDSYTVDLESAVTITCTDIAASDESNQTRMFSWKKDEQSLFSGGTVSIVEVSSSVSVLTVGDISLSDSGWYKCIIVNDVGSNSKVVNIIVEDPPLIVGLSDEHVNFVSGCNASLLVRLEYGFLDPNVTWSRQQTGNSKLEEIVADGSHYLFSGDHGLNLTVIDVAVADSGKYFLNVTSTKATASLWFQVSVLVPTQLEPITESPLVLPTGSSVLIEVTIFDAIPPVVEDNVTWTPSGGVETFDGNLASVSLSAISPGNPSEVVVAVNHPAGDKHYSFQLTILDPPDAPVNFTVTAYQGKTCTAVFTWQAAVPVNNMTSATTDSIGLEWSLTGMDQWQAFGDQLYPVNEFVMVDLLPETMYHFRAYSWSNLVGRGGETINDTYSTISNNVLQVTVTGISSSEVSVSWSSPQPHSDCYLLTSYQLTCQNSEDQIIINTTSIKLDPSLDSYSVIISDLPPDASFNCSVLVVGQDSSGSPLPITPAASDTGFTLPSAPPKPSTPTVANEQGPAHTITLDLSALRESLIPDDASHVWIAVIRLVSPTLPAAPADQLYPDESLFVDSPQSGSPMKSVTDGHYQPYLAAELNVGSIPAVFTVGNDSNGDTSAIIDHQILEIYNGPLNGSDYYTCFFRVFSFSAQLGKQYDVFTSSEYLTPMRPVSEDVQSTPSTVNTVGIMVGVTVAILVLAILLLVVLVVFLCVRTRGKTTPTTNDPEYEIAFGTPKRDPLSTTSNIAYRTGQQDLASTSQNTSSGVYEDI